MIVCSAFVSIELEEELRQKGACVLRKPIMLDELNEALQICLTKDQRKEIREQIIGDLLWSYSPSTDKNKGMRLEESRSGISMTYVPLRVGSVVRIDMDRFTLCNRSMVSRGCPESI